MNHGTLTAYEQGCTCELCTIANRDYKRVYMRELRAGQPRTVDATETRQHIRWLLKKGRYSAATISDLNGLSDQCVINITTGKTKRVKHSTADAVLSLTLREEPSDGHLVSAVPAANLLKAMRKNGVKAKDIVAWLGYRPSSSIPTARNRRITYRNHRRIVTLYHLLASRGVVPARPLLEVTK